MKAWTPVCLALLIAQAPVSPDTGIGPDIEPSPGLPLGPEPGEQQVEPFQEQLFEQPPEELSPSEEMRQLRLRIQQLEARFQEQQALEEEQQALEEEQQAEERLQSLEEQQATLQARALELQQLQQQRVVSLENAYGWFVTIENQLDGGNLDATSPALTNADAALAVALSTALETGRDQTVLLLERARDRLFVIRQALAARDVYAARVELQLAALEVWQAWQQALNRPDSSNLIR
ncbi:MAG TPA: hypothetical protein VLQ93_17910 [Myxococcaceae bacterium]|nr:hypothetical protein [Myxococcaceae bacterium]